MVRAVFLLWFSTSAGLAWIDGREQVSMAALGLATLILASYLIPNRAAFLLLFSITAGLAWIAGQEQASMAALGLATLILASYLIPNRTASSDPLPDYKESDKDPEQAETSYSNHLYRKQGGWGGQRAACAGCRERYLLKDFEIDHIHPQAKGGGDELENLQLLCANCNRRKGKRTMDELRASLRADGIIRQ